MFNSTFACFITTTNDSNYTNFGCADSINSKEINDEREYKFVIFVKFVVKKKICVPEKLEIFNVCSLTCNRDSVLSG